MANYFVLNNKFKPYSFDELIKPYQIYGEAYKEQEAALDAAREKEFSPAYLDQTQDKVAYNMYTQASQGLQAVSDELATRGLSAGLRNRLKSTARDYKRTMDTLTEAQTRLYAERDRRAKAGDDYRYQQEDLRIGDFLNGATPNQRGVSLSGITKDIATDFATRANTITDDTWSKVLDQNGKVVGGYFDVTTKSGLTAAQLDTILSDEDTWSRIMNNTAISSTEKANLQRFRDVISSKKRSIEYDAYDLQDQASIDDAILRGATAGLGSTTHKYEVDRGYDPLGWERLSFEKSKYGDALAAQVVALQAKYPQFQFDEKGNLVKNTDGSLKVNEGWTQKNGKWQNLNNPTGTSSSAQAKSPFVGVKYYDKSGNVKFFGSDKDWANAQTGTAVTNVSQLSRENIQRLALDLGILGAASDQEIFNEAIRRGWTISVVDKKLDKDSEGNRTIPTSNQELIIRGTKAYADPTENYLVGNSLIDTDAGDYDADSVPE